MIQINVYDFDLMYSYINKTRRQSSKSIRNRKKITKEIKKTSLKEENKKLTLPFFTIDFIVVFNCHEA